jgi:hypothetical protein
MQSLSRGKFGQDKVEITTFRASNDRLGNAVIRSVFHISICSLTIALSVLAVAAQGKRADGKTEDTRQVINYLIEEMKSSHLTFIRNGKSYSSEQAAEHARTKYRYFRSQPRGGSPDSKSAK